MTMKVYIISKHILGVSMFVPLLFGGLIRVSTDRQGRQQVYVSA
jgi:hypothetical protein